MVESAKTHIRKPEPGIYETVLKGLNISGRDAIFLDDLGQNLKAAAEFGIKTIKVCYACCIMLIRYTCRCESNMY